MAGATAAVMAKIQENERAAAAMAVTMKQMQEQGGSLPPGANIDTDSAPDLAPTGGSRESTDGA